MTSKRCSLLSLLFFNRLYFQCFIILLANRMISSSLKVNEWAEGKRGNIRALLCSLHLILWEEESRWKPCGMHNLVQPDQVTYSYALLFQPCNTCKERGLGRRVKLKRPKIDHYAFRASVVDLVDMIVRFLLFSNAAQRAMYPGKNWVLKSC